MTDTHLAASENAYFLPHALVAFGVAAVLGLLGWRLLVLRVRGVPVTGVCVKHTYGKTGVAVVVRFTPASGGSLTCLGRPAAVAEARVGQPVTVVYDPRNPKNAEIPRSASRLPQHCSSPPRFWP
ncbi:DUF3592 domain-containing protein [Yinghuangia aomiensis]